MVSVVKELVQDWSATKGKLEETTKSSREKE